MRPSMPGGTEKVPAVASRKKPPCDLLATAATSVNVTVISIVYVVLGT
jgi:hypothetical protein